MTLIGIKISHIDANTERVSIRFQVAGHASLDFRTRCEEFVDAIRHLPVDQASFLDGKLTYATVMAEPTTDYGVSRIMIGAEAFRVSETSLFRYLGGDRVVKV